MTAPSERVTTTIAKTPTQTMEQCRKALEKGPASLLLRLWLSHPITMYKAYDGYIKEGREQIKDTFPSHL